MQLYYNEHNPSVKQDIPKKLIKKYPRSVWLAGCEALERRRKLAALERQVGNFGDYSNGYNGANNGNYQTRNGGKQ